MKSTHKIVLEYVTYETYEIDPDDIKAGEYYPGPGKLIEKYERDPVYAVIETSYFDNGEVSSEDTLNSFDDYTDAEAYMKSLKEGHEN